MSLSISQPFHIEFLKRMGLKITAPRLKVLRILEQEHLRHFTAEALYEALKRGRRNCFSDSLPNSNSI